MYKKPKKNNILIDSLETMGDQIKDLGKETVKETAKAATLSFVQDLYRPSDEKGNASGQEGKNPTTQDAASKESPQTSEKKKSGNSTPLDIDELRKKQHRTDEDEAALDVLRKKLFEKVKDDESDAQRYFKEKEQNKKNEEAQEEENKKRRIEQQRSSQQSSNIPQGKEQRGGLFGKKKKAVKQSVAEQQPEMRGSGKH